MLNKGLMAIETIDTQNDRFGDDMLRLVSSVVKEVENATSEIRLTNHPAVDGLEKLIFSRLGLKVTFITNEAPAAILPFYSNKNHIFLPDFFRGNISLRDQNRLLDKFEDRKGSVNLQTAKLSGIFSEYDHPLYVNFYFLVKHFSMSAGDITAIILHELGHGFNACYYADRTDRTNQVLASVARRIVGQEKGDIEYVYKELLTVSPSITKEAVDTILNGNRIVAGVTWFKTVVGIVKSQMSDDTYNNTAFEASSDSFASRFGYGKQLLIALDKISQGAPEKSKSVYYLVQTLNALTTVCLAVLILSAIAGAAVGPAFIFGIVSFIFMTVSRQDVMDHTYDELKQRYIRLRTDAIDQLKVPSLPRDRVKDLLEGIYAMDEVIKETSVVKTLSMKIADFLFSGSRQAAVSINDQQSLEQLASNDMFFRAADFRLKSQEK